MGVEPTHSMTTLTSHRFASDSFGDPSSVLNSSQQSIVHLLQRLRSTSERHSVKHPLPSIADGYFVMRLSEVGLSLEEICHLTVTVVYVMDSSVHIMALKWSIK